MDKNYDVVIIGAGIGGLVCGCYLAKKGRKVLIIEQHTKPGGYCTSFYRKSYRFDVGVRYVGSVRKGVLNKIFKELNLLNRITFSQFNPTDTIITNESVTKIYSDFDSTLKEFKKNFPREKKPIDKFFKLITNTDIAKIYSQVKNKTFDEILNTFFPRKSIKLTLGALLKNLALAPSEMPAFNAIVFFREFILDSGFYPIGGAQIIPDVIVEEFKNSGGQLVLENKINKIKVTDNKVRAVIDTNDNEIRTKCVVSNADAFETFEQLIDIKSSEKKVVNSLKPTSSMFVIYTGIKNKLSEFLNDSSDIWYIGQENDRDENFVSRKYNLLISFPYLHDSSMHRYLSTIQIYSFAPFKDAEFWNKNRYEVESKILQQTKSILTFFDKLNIEVSVNATPQTFFNYTLNQNGSCFGAMPNLNDSNFLKNTTSIEGLFLAGHWCNNGKDVGVSGAALSGRKCAEIVLKKLGKNWRYGMIRL